MSEPSEKRRPDWKYWGRVIKHSGSEFSPVEAISEMAVGAMIAIATPGESVHAMIIEIIGYALGIPALAFLLRCLFITPAKLYREVEEKLEIAEAQINERENVKPLEIEPIPIKYTPIHNTVIEVASENNNIFETTAELSIAAECGVYIYNPNQGVTVARVRVLKIEPPMSSNIRKASTDDCNLRGLYLPFTDIPDEAINTDARGHICVFKIHRTPKLITVKFTGRWNDACPNEFIPQKEHIVTIEAEARNVPPKPYQFKMSFSLDQTQPIFTLEKIELPGVVNPSENFVGKIYEKTRKRRDPASVAILLCLTSSLAMLTLAQRIQISKLKNPPVAAPQHFDTRPVTKKEPTSQASPTPMAQASKVEPQKQFKPTVTGHMGLSAAGSDSDDILKEGLERMAQEKAQQQSKVQTWPRPNGCAPS